MKKIKAKIQLLIGLTLAELINFERQLYQRLVRLFYKHAPLKTVTVFKDDKFDYNSNEHHTVYMEFRCGLIFLNNGIISYSTALNEGLKECYFALGKISFAKDAIVVWLEDGYYDAMSLDVSVYSLNLVAGLIAGDVKEVIELLGDKFELDPDLLVNTYCKDDKFAGKSGVTQV